MLYIAVACFALNLIIFAQRTFAADGASAAGWLDSVQGATSAITFVVLVAGIFWYVFLGRSREQIKEERDAFKNRAELLKTEKAELETEIEKERAEKKILYIKRRVDNKIVYRLVAKIEGESGDQFDIDSLREEIIDELIRELRLMI